MGRESWKEARKTGDGTYATLRGLLDGMVEAGDDLASTTVEYWNYGIGKEAAAKTAYRIRHGLRVLPDADGGDSGAGKWHAAVDSSTGDHVVWVRYQP